MVKKNILNFLIILFIFLLDRFSKIFIINSNDIYIGNEVFLTPFLNLTLVWNEGIAFGLFSFEDKIYYHSLTAIIILITIIILIMIIKSIGLEKYGFVVIFGGSIGNIFDRIRYSSVPDFIDIHFNNFHWFIFNVADIFITVGVLILIFNEIILKQKT
jgi:signal peptidase II